MSELYRAIKRHYPDMSDGAIDRMMGFSNGATNKVKLGSVPGLKAAKWMAERHPEYENLLDRIQAEVDQNRKKPKGGGRVRRNTKIQRMSVHCRRMAGYLP